jgi:hypothetical protein
MTLWGQSMTQVPSNPGWSLPSRTENRKFNFGGSLCSTIVFFRDRHPCHICHFHNSYKLEQCEEKSSSNPGSAMIGISSRQMTIATGGPKGFLSILIGKRRRDRGTRAHPLGQLESTDLCGLGVAVRRYSSMRD